MLCPKCLQYSPIVASNMLNNCSFKCLVCNNVEMLDNEFTPIASSLFGDFSCAHIDNLDHAFRALCNKCLNYSPIVATKMLNNCSFKCLVCNNVAILSNEIAPIAFSNFGDFSCAYVENFPPFTLHVHHSHISKFPYLFGYFGDVHKTRHVMMDDVFIYHKQNFLIWYFGNALRKRHIPTT